MTAKIPVSAAIITLNEERHIGECLDSLRWAEEVVVVDSLSTDGTVRICEEKGAKVHPQKFLGHIEQKQMAVELCARDWVFCIDADERVSEELAEDLRALFEKGDPPLAGYGMNRKNLYLGRWVRHGGWYPDHKIRLFNRRKGRWGAYNPHDKVLIEGKAGILKGDLIHYPFRDLGHNVAANNSYSTIMANELFEKGAKFSYSKLLFKPIWKFVECYLLKRGFLDGSAGFLIAVGAAYSMFLKQAKLWERHLGKASTANPRKS